MFRGGFALPGLAEVRFLRQAGCRDRRACRADRETGATGYASEIHRSVIKSPTQADVFVDDGNVEISRYAYRGWRVEGA